MQDYFHTPWNFRLLCTEQNSIALSVIGEESIDFGIFIFSVSANTEGSDETVRMQSI